LQAGRFILSIPCPTNIQERPLAVQWRRSLNGLLEHFVERFIQGRAYQYHETTLDFAGGTSLQGPVRLVNVALATLAGTVNLAGPHFFINGVVNFIGNYACANAMTIAGAHASFNSTGPVITLPTWHRCN
jgi:hypothetical protein